MSREVTAFTRREINTDWETLSEQDKEAIREELPNKILEIGYDADPIRIEKVTEVDCDSPLEGLGEPPYLLCMSTGGRFWLIDYTQATLLLTRGFYNAFFDDNDKNRVHRIGLLRHPL